ncbi:MAG: MBL fold metallo-hydrolase [Candidatus Thermoplasmatota archaeon]|nr:MBL fold metallo-hydrolase [Candidatus Thermoplasmatota archaeon]
MKDRLVKNQVNLVDDLNNIYSVGKDRYGLSEGQCFFIDSEKKVLIESGNSLAFGKIVEDLSELGIKNLDYIMVTHIHMDHAGGAGYLLDRYPDTEIVVHESGSNHLVDPAKLKKSVKKVTGSAFKYFGDIKPIPEENIVPVSGGERFDLGRGYSIEVIYSPGHAPHHTCFLERKTGSLALGDVAGRYYPEKDALFPTTPPPNFDLQENLKTLSRLKDLDLDFLLYSHKRWSDQPNENLSRYEAELEEWVDEIKGISTACDDKEDVIERIIKKYEPKLKRLLDGDDEKVKHILRMNTKGVLLYLEKKPGQR